MSGAKETVLILGCGYLGMRLVARFRTLGWRVKAVSRNADRLAEAESAGAEVFEGLVNEDGWHAFAGADVGAVVNCVSSAGGGLAGYRQSYVEGNASLCRWAQATGFSGKAVYTSSVSVYPDAGGAEVDEDWPEPPSNERGKLVQESEALFLDGLGVAKGYVLRLAGLYGPGRHLMMDKVREGPSELPGWGDYYLNLVRIEDVVSAVEVTLTQGAADAGVYNVVDDGGALKAEIVAWLAERFGHVAPEFTGVAPTSGRASRRFGEGGRPANRRISNRKLRAATGWAPRFADFRAGFGDLMGERTGAE